jgi:hypothetical protein
MPEIPVGREDGDLPLPVNTDFWSPDTVQTIVAMLGIACITRLEYSMKRDR